mmetsp:Transcript_7234/g.11789  ORF Transcript_7234/g.11789 Transcript_7234/m.11789 type:complete len:87 (-) Transcript_7234:91-351(-)
MHSESCNLPGLQCRQSAHVSQNTASATRERFTCIAAPRFEVRARVQYASAARSCKVRLSNMFSRTTYLDSLERENMVGTKSIPLFV